MILELYQTEPLPLKMDFHRRWQYQETKNKYSEEGIRTIDAKGKVVLPGFVDCHTHAVFGGDRTREFVQRIQGATYLEILKKAMVY